MNLWILWLLAAISLTTALGDPVEWFISDVDEWAETDDFLSQESLIPIQRRKVLKLKRPTSVSTSQGSSKSKSDASKSKPLSDEASSKTIHFVSKTKEFTTELKSQNSNLVSTNSGKPLQVSSTKKEILLDVVRPNALSQSKKQDDTETEKNKEKIKCEDPEKDINCLMQDEDLIIVKPKTSSKPKPKESSKPKSTKSLKSDVKVKETKKPKDVSKHVEEITKKLPSSKQDSQKSELTKSKSINTKSTAKVNSTEPEVRVEVLRRKLLQDQDSIDSVLTSKESVSDSQSKVLTNQQQAERDQTQNTKVPDDDVLPIELEFEEVDEDMDTVVERLKRQANEDTGSGGGNDGLFDNKKPTNQENSVIWPFKYTFQNPHTSGTLTAADIAKYKSAVEAQLADAFPSNKGFQGVVVSKVYLDKNNRVVVDIEVKVDPQRIGATGQTAQQKVQSTIDHLKTAGIPAMNKLNVDGNPVYNNAKLDPDIAAATYRSLLENPCQGSNPCPKNYDSCQASGILAGQCTHKCYSSNLVNLCSNGASCQIDSKTDTPYCRCGNKFTGQYCQNPVKQDKPALSTGEIIGITTGAALFGLAACSLCIYLAFFRRKKDLDMNYSYFGDESQPLDGYSDPDSQLGSRNFYIDRPRVSIVPFDI